jgi:hypothetical protein
MRLGKGLRRLGGLFLNQPGTSQLRLFKLLQHGLRPTDHTGREPGKFSDVDTITPVGFSRHDFSEKHDVAAAFLNGHAIIFDSGPLLFQLCHLMVMGREQRACT